MSRTPTSTSPRRIRSAVAGSATVLVAAGLLTACSSGNASTASGYDGPIGALDLSTACPDTVVIQTDWNPEAEHGGLYQLLGPEPRIDADAKRTSGPLFVGGEYTGVDIEIRAGGPAIGFQTVTSQMYQDPSILLGYVDTDQALQSQATKPTTAVYASMEISPMMVMWDPATYPDVKQISDLKAKNATVLYFEGTAYMDYLTGSGILSPDQVDGSYDGTPANFVTSGGAKAQQGYASAEPYVYENEIEGWKKPVDFQLVHDAGFPTYKLPLAIRSGALEENRGCLEKLVPALQQSTIDYFTSPQKADDVIIDAVSAYNTGWVYGPENATYAGTTMKELGLVGNGPTATHGDFDTARVQRVIDIMRPIYTSQGIDVPADLTPADLATNEFLDPSIQFQG